jgi:sugar lactone lactonase YvrE
VLSLGKEPQRYRDGKAAACFSFAKEFADESLGKPMNVIATFSVSPAALDIVVTGLNRPECVLATEDGHLYSADWRGGVAISCPRDGSASSLVRGIINERRPTRPNGIARTARGSWLMADLGESEGGIFELFSDGRLVPRVVAMDGKPIPPSNFVIEDAQQRIWFTVSTRLVPRSRAWNAHVSDGFIAVVDKRGARIVADGLGYTNEIAFSPDGQWLYVNETYAKRVSRFRLLADATLGPRETVAHTGFGNFPDGITFDAAGNAWITCIVSNRVLVLQPDGEQRVVLDGADLPFVTDFESKYERGLLQPSDTQTCGKSPLGNISSLAFGGSDLKTAYLGCLLDDKIRSFRSPVAGHPPLHWSH